MISEDKQSRDALSSPRSVRSDASVWEDALNAPDSELLNGFDSHKKTFGVSSSDLISGIDSAIKPVRKTSLLIRMLKSKNGRGIISGYTLASASERAMFEETLNAKERR